MHSHPVQTDRLFRTLLTERLRWRLAVLGVSFIATTLGLLTPYFQKEFIDLLLASQSAVIWIVLAFTTALGQQALTQLASWLAVRESAFSQKALTEALYRRLLWTRGGLIGRGAVGEAVSLFAVDIPGASALLEQCLAAGASVLFPVILAPIALRYFFSIPLSGSFLVIGVLVTIYGILAYRQSKFFYHFKALAGERTGFVTEWIQNIRALRILGWTRATEKRIFEVRERETQNRVSMVTNAQFMNSIAGSATFAINTLAVWALVSIRGASATPGELLALLWVLGVFLARPLRQFPWFFVISLDAISSIRRLESAFAKESPSPRLLAPLSHETQKPDPELETAPPALRIEGMNLEIGGRKLLSDIDVQIAKGEFVAFIGEVGSGKSLLLLSLMGETRATFRSFEVDGVLTDGPIVPEVRSRFAYVPQEGFTMSATLRENVLFEYGADTLRDTAAVDALERSELPLDLEGLPHGLDTEIGERGVNLSGGQRQRIGLARAAYADRSIILLDDCLSAVDVDTERRLIDGLLLGVWKDLPRILVTHRMSVLDYCDRVIFLEAGRVVMQGRHADLFARSERYREFVSTAERPSDG